MYWLSYMVIALIIGGLIMAWKTEVYLTQILVIVNLLIFMLVNITGFRYPGLRETVFNDLAGRAVYLQTGESLHTFLTLMFLHANYMHIAGNILVLFFIGIALEDRVGKGRVTMLFFTTGLIATLGQYSINWGSGTLNLGASGAVMGLMGAMVYLYPRDRIPMFLGPIFMPAVRVDLAVVVFVAMQTGIALLDPHGNIAHAAHFAGFAGGMFMALLMRGYITGQGAKTVEKDHTHLKKLVTNSELHRIYENINKADTPEIREAWVEHFMEKAVCPVCSRPLKGNRCDCGFRLRE